MCSICSELGFLILQIFYYIRSTKPKRVTSFRGNFRVAGPTGNTALFEVMSQRWRAIDNTVSDLTGVRFEPQTSHSRDESVTAGMVLFLMSYTHKYGIFFQQIYIKKIKY